MEEITENGANAMSDCTPGSRVWTSGGATGPLLFFETAQHVLFAQQSGLQPSALGAFARMQDAAGSLSGLANIATTTAKRMGAVLRIDKHLARDAESVEFRALQNRTLITLPRFSCSFPASASLKA